MTRKTNAPAQEPVHASPSAAVGSVALERLTDALPVLISYIGPDRRYRFMNASYERWFGYEQSEALGRTLEEVLGEEAVRTLAPHIDAALAGKHVTFVNDAPYREGGTRRVRATYAPVRDEQGRPDGFVALVEDITTEKAAEERVRVLGEASDLLASSLEIDATLRALTELCVPRLADWCAVELLKDGTPEQVAVAHIDPDKVALALDIRERYPRDPNAGVGVAAVLRTGEPQLIAEITDAMIDAAAVNDEHRQLLGTLGLASSVVAPIALRGRVLGALTLVRNGDRPPFNQTDVEVALEICRRAAQAIENAKLFSAAQEATRRKDEFMAMLGHELRNPLAPIRTALEVMKLRGDGHSTREQEVIARQVDHLGRLVDDLLDVSRVTSGKILLQRSPIEIAVVVTKAVEVASTLLEQRAHHVSIAVPRRGLLVHADQTRMSQVLANLLTNAAKYTEPGGQIAVRAFRDGEWVCVEIEDNGIGIAPELLPRVFDLFTQGPQPIDRAQGGLGLGLRLVQSLVEMHAGAVEARSEGQGKGSCFRVSLPALTITEARATARAQQVHAAKDGDPTPGRRQRLLVVDDNEDACEMLALGLRGAGHEVEVAHDGPRALALVDRFKPDVALLDIGLPAMDGYELGRRLRKKLGSGVRLFSVTGYGMERDQQQSHAAGFEHHMVKPVSLQLLLRAINGTIMDRDQ